MRAYALLCIAVVGCSVETASIPQSAAITFHRDVEPILQKSCQGCHVEGGIAPFSLTSYEQAKDYAELMVLQTASGKMPPWGARSTSECTPPLPYANDPSLTQADLDTLRGWHDIGMPEGDPKDAPPPLAPPVMGIANPTLTLTPNDPYTVASGGDQFRCFVLDPKITQTQYISAQAVLPGNKGVVHHVLVFADPNGESKAKGGASGQYDCFGGAGLTNQSLLMAWAPGGQPTTYPDGVAMPIDPGSLLVMQIHYHPSAQAIDRSDKTSIQMRLSSDAPQYLALTRLLGNFPGALPTAPGDGLQPDPDDRGKLEFRIPAGVASHTETMRVTLPQAIKGIPTPELGLYGVGGHMHYVGRDVKVSYLRASDQSNQCLLEIPQWDFNWQRGYPYAAPIGSLPKLHPGDRIEVKCTYDNSLSNPFMAQALTEQGLTQPRDVVLGESTLDEMCLGAFTFLVKR
jgi:hypothetical protein